MSNEDKDEVRYHDGITPVLIGDHVLVRGLILFFVKKKGRVIYVPGLSDPHPEMEYGGLMDVGVDFDDGTFSGIYVDPRTNLLQETVSFLRRDVSAVRELRPSDSLDD